MSSICANCGGVEIEYDAARGDAVCVKCGSVLEDNIIVSEVSFQEQTSGATSVIGQFVSAEGQNNPLSGTGFHHGMGKGSREVTLMHARRRISTLGNQMKLNQHCIDSAFVYFKLALNLNLTRGRKAGLIDTACLYLVCRTEGTPHLLLDFSDVLQMNVYALGRAFLRLTNTLHINPPVLDPCLYIHRFAHKLELGDKEHEVSKTALRLVARMKRDWLHHGRRPTGLCGAALLIAARLHNFSRTVKEVAKVVKINESTIRKRLGDFKDTPSSRLTIEEFLQINLEQEHDPPSYAEARKKPKLATASGLDQGEEPSTSEDAAALPISLDGNDTMTNTGISLQSVEATIAKAQATEQFQAKILPSLGLSSDLASLAKYADDIANGNTAKEDGDSDLAEVDDDEIETMLLNPDEVHLKSKIWFEENGDYLKEQEERREKLLAEKAAQGEKKKRGYKRRRPLNQHVTANSAGEAIQQMLVEKKISSKINYDVLRGLSDDNPAQESTEHSTATTTPSTQPSSLSRKRTFSLVDSSSGSSGSSSSSNNKISSPGIFSSPKSSRLPSLKGPQGGYTSSLVKQTPLQPEPEPEEEPTLLTVEVVEETGPINYAEDGDLDVNLDEDDMTYPGDPLYLSDYEDANYDDDDGDDVY